MNPPMLIVDGRATPISPDQEAQFRQATSIVANVAYMDDEGRRYTKRVTAYRVPQAGDNFVFQTPPDEIAISSIATPANRPR